MGLTAVNLKNSLVFRIMTTCCSFLSPPPFSFPRRYMCINSASQGYRIASSTAVTSQCYGEFFMQSRGITTSGKTYTCQNARCISGTGSGKLLVPVYNTHVDGTCNTVVQGCVVN